MKKRIVFGIVIVFIIVIIIMIGSNKRNNSQELEENNSKNSTYEMTEHNGNYVVYNRETNEVLVEIDDEGLAKYYMMHPDYNP